MLEDAREACADLFAEASSVLGYDLWDLVENGPENQLNQTEYTQPALLTASIALFRLAQVRHGVCIAYWRKLIHKDIRF